MRARASPASLPRAPSAARETARAAAALAISLVALPLWEASGAKEAYRRVVVGLAERIVLATQHFPLLSRFPDLAPPESDFVVLLSIALVAVSIGIGWRRRLRLAGVALLATAGLQVLAAVAVIHIESAQEMQRTQGILVLLPVEFRAVSQAKMIVYYAQLALIFLLFVGTSPWLAARERTHPQIGRRRLALAITVAAITVLASGIAWGRWRETDARHVAAHAKIGNLFWAKHDDAIAEAQYRIAAAGRTTDPQVYFNLAGLALRSGRLSEAGAMLTRCAEVGTDEAWRARIAKARDIMMRR